MKINELINNINNKNFDIEKELQVKKYLPIEEKKLIAKGIIYECTERVNGVIKVDSVQQELSYIKYMILRHTNLEYTHEDYDALCSTDYNGTDLLTAIINTFKKDADACNDILTAMLDDRIQDNALEFVVAKFLSGVSEMLASKLDEIDFNAMIPQNMDAEKLTKFLNTYVK